jgi:MFS family permease
MKKLIVMSVVIIICSTSSLVHAESYWLTGGLIGTGVGVATGVGGAYVTCGLAEHNRGKCRKIAMPAAGVAAGGIGFGVGALIGYAFKKDDKTVHIIVDPKTETYGAGMSFRF